MAKSSRQTKLPGTIYLLKLTAWPVWEITNYESLITKTKARPLKPVGGKYATKDVGIAREVAEIPAYIDL